MGYDRSGDEPKTGRIFFQLTTQNITEQDDDYAETPLAFIQEAPDLNLGRDIVGFSWFLSLPFGELWDDSLKYTIRVSSQIHKFAPILTN
jgi:hypothetical protein